MVDSVPAIRLTDPQSRDANPVYPLSPELSAHTLTSKWDQDSSPVDSPHSKRDSMTIDRDGRPTSPIARAGAMVRGLSRELTGSSSKPDPSYVKDNRPTQPEPAMAVDPVTQQIFDRQGAVSPVPRHDSAETEPSADEHVQRTDSIKSSAPPPRSAMRTALETSRQQKKENRVSFFSRIMHGKKKDSQETQPDDASIVSRPEGHDAEVFSPVLPDSDVGHMQQQSPSYIRVRTRHSRKRRHFDALFLAQELVTEERPEPHPNGRQRSSIAVNPASPQRTAWAAEFSRDGKYLATAGHDGIVRVWAVITSQAERDSETHADMDDPAATINTAAIFKSKPHREYHGHTSTVLDLSWSKNGFLISSSMDKTVKLWHVSREQCLCTFKHNDYVPSVCFHPKDDKYFLAGSLDCKLRMWSVHEKRVAYWCQLQSMITAVAFTPDGKSAIAGCSDGSCHFYETDGLRYQTQVKVRMGDGKHDKGAKITGINTYSHPLHGDTKLVVTSNDSRVRIYNFRDKSLEWKLKGSINNTCQIRAAVSDDGCYIGCGSEDKRAYLWPLDSVSDEDPSKRPVEHFQAHESMVTCVRFAPSKTRNIVGQSGDPIFDICNPGFQNLARNLARDEAASEVSSRHANEALDSSYAPSLVRQHSDNSTRGPAQRCPHYGGNIIITASQMGSLKVFRQDCAARHRHGSTSSRKLPALGLSRRGTTSLRSKQSSRSLQSTTSTQAPSDRILSWRQDIHTSPARRTPSVGSKVSVDSASPKHPRAAHQHDDHHIHPLSTMKRFFQHPNTSSHSSLPAPSPQHEEEPEQQQQRPATEPRDHSSSHGPSPDAQHKNPLALSGKQSDLFWNTSVAKNFYARALAPDDDDDDLGPKDEQQLLRPGGRMNRAASEVSKLSIERTVSGSSGTPSPALS